MTGQSPPSEASDQEGRGSRSRTAEARTEKGLASKDEFCNSRVFGKLCRLANLGGLRSARAPSHASSALCSEGAPELTAEPPCRPSVSAAGAASLHRLRPRRPAGPPRRLPWMPRRLPCPRGTPHREGRPLVLPPRLGPPAEGLRKAAHQPSSLRTAEVKGSTALAR